jgi:hypothetical protein
MHRRCSRRLAAASLTLAAIVARPTKLFAANQEPSGLNLGLTSFFDGFGPSSEGFTYQAYFTSANATTIYDGDGREVPAFRDPRISVFALVNQLSYFLPQTLFDDAVRPGIDFILPLVLFDTSFGTMGPSLTATRIGFGDLTMGPMFQFTPIMVDGHPIFSHRLGLDVIVPVGRYDLGRNLNPSSNFVSLNPNWAATVVAAPGLEVSVRLHYLYNMKNARPTNPPPGVMVDTAQAGQAVWLNFAASYELIRSLHIGANGYYFKQLTADDYRLPDGTHRDAVELHEGKAQVLGIGPGALWDPSERRDNQLFANVYFETLVQARAAATVVNLRWLHTF